MQNYKIFIFSTIVLYTSIIIYASAQNSQSFTSSQYFNNQASSSSNMRTRSISDDASQVRLRANSAPHFPTLEDSSQIVSGSVPRVESYIPEELRKALSREEKTNDSISNSNESSDHEDNGSKHSDNDNDEALFDIDDLDVSSHSPSAQHKFTKKIDGTHQQIN